jgi:hypothetical protein
MAHIYHYPMKMKWVQYNIMPYIIGESNITFKAAKQYLSNQMWAF